MKPCACRRDESGPCSSCEARIEATHHADDIPAPDRDQFADEQADREERQRDEMWGAVL